MRITSVPKTPSSVASSAGSDPDHPTCPVPLSPVSSFEEWTRRRDIRHLGSNAGSAQLPFQTWRRFKEAFAPELVLRATRTSDHPIRRCLDPFAGSGTTALACQFLGIDSTSVEVNPFLADLTEAKLTAYNPDQLARDLGIILRTPIRPLASPHFFNEAPRTFVEPGVSGRWIFDRAVAERIQALLASIDSLSQPSHRRFFRVILGGILIDVSNVVVSGKGRRYRRGWQGHNRSVHDVDDSFSQHAAKAIAEIHRFSRRPNTSFQVIRGDSRCVNYLRHKCDLAVFSPPYPNSFDYTDVYNVELWALGYLTRKEDNRTLRLSTLSSHVQLERAFAKAPGTSPTLSRTVSKLHSIRDQLWSKWLPDMVGAYFADLTMVLQRVAQALHQKASAWLVVGDSRYGAVHVPTATIVAEMATHLGYSVEHLEPFRSMRASPQQGGRHQLAETLVVLRRR